MRRHTVLVTGANGFIGHHLCRKLLEGGHTVIAVSRKNKPERLHACLQKPAFRLITGDLKEAFFIENIFRIQPVDAVFHLAIAEPATRQKAQPVAENIQFKINFEITLNLLHAATMNGVRGWIQSSSMSVYNYENPPYLPVDEKQSPVPIGEYGLSKLLADISCEYFANNHELRMIILRYSGVYGPGKNRGIIDRLMKSTINSSDSNIEISDNRTSDFVYVQDVVSANLLALNFMFSENNLSAGKTSYAEKRQVCEIFNIGSGEENSPYDAARIFMKITGRQLNLEKVSASNARRFYFDIRKAREILGYNPCSLKTGLADFVKAGD